MLNQQNQAENDQALNNVGSGVKNAAQDGVGSTGRAARSGINYLRDKKGKGKEAKESDRASDKEGAESNSNRADNQKVQNEPRSQQSPQNQQKTAPKGSQNTTKVQNGPQGNKQQTGSTPTSSSVKKTGKVASSSIKGTKGAGEGAAKASTSSVKDTLKASISATKKVADTVNKTKNVARIAIAVFVVLALVLIAIFGAALDNENCLPVALTGSEIEIPEPNGTAATREFDLGTRDFPAGTTQRQIQDAWKAAGSVYDSNGFCTLNGRYLIATTSVFGQLGDAVDFYMSNGTVLQTIKIDAKAETVVPHDPNPANKWGHQDGKIVLEFCGKPTIGDNPYTTLGLVGQRTIKAVNGGNYQTAASSAVASSAVTDGPITASGKKLADTARTYPNNLPSNMCSQWVQNVQAAAGLSGYIGGTGGAYQTWQAFVSKGMGHTEKTGIPIGAFVFGSGSGGPGASFGHVGIYLGGGKVIDQSHAGTAGQDLNTWCSWQTAVNSDGKSGWKGWVLPFDDATEIAGSSGDVWGACDTAEMIDSVPYYGQYESPWASVPYWDGTIQTSGCGLCAVASGISGIFGERITPDTLVDSHADGSTPKLLNYVKTKYDIKYQEIAKNVDAYTNALQSGKMLVVSVKGKIPTRTYERGHFVLLYGYENGKCKMMDPGTNKGKEIHGQYVIDIAEAANWGKGGSTPTAFWSDSATNITNVTNSKYTGAKLTRTAGRIEGPSGQETYYRMDMSEICRNLDSRSGWLWSDIVAHGNTGNVKGKTYVRSDGVWMCGPYVMVAANLKVRPRGSLVQSSLGMAIVVDTGGFAANNPTQLDIAVTWQ